MKLPAGTTQTGEQHPFAPRNGHKDLADLPYSGLACGTQKQFCRELPSLERWPNGRLPRRSAGLRTVRRITAKLYCVVQGGSHAVGFHQLSQICRAAAGHPAPEEKFDLW
jgi:hypothetical protein